MSNYQTPTTQTYEGLERAFWHFNDRLFDNRLSEVMITLQRKRNVHGYYWPEQFLHRDDEDRMPEIALNPNTMGRTVREVLSTLVHEMVHHWQHQYGKPGKNGHHNKEWAAKMDRVGLEPTSTGAPGGERTGRKVTHMITEGGMFDTACAELLETGFDLPWHALQPDAKPKKKDPSKVKHSCPECNQNVWGKLGIRVICGDCDMEMEAEQ